MSTVFQKIIRAISKVLTSPFYKIRARNLKVPEQGAFVGVANHASYLDAIVIACVVKRPMRFVMYWKIYELPLLKYIFKALGAIPIASPRENKEVYQKAVKAMDAEIQAGGAVFIFPEGMITHNGELNEFKSGAVRLAQKNQCPVIPMGINGVWGSVFSRAKKRTTALWRRKIEVLGGDKVEHQEVTQDRLFEEVKTLVTR
ncbi:TPA: 1-acyl-sn-glycerol-3-phosphate acyltransferase [Vibrio vulnificus]|uniref:1-acyl-sn-glycerol-3-phosphate acyltransferase n=1 Tax=Vibrio vulnificus TaxID=672 RepID=A0A8H9K7D2_VIBVL|nr:1-acyl-sn-glycerol-3-phosphate acyltransferase [Vibrio vulnificus]HAS8538464.1 1-acyl-sn-glycerol-3-phosphate acyltransferase [Vibrio vulnificus]